jgi:hypothetical protein
MSAVGSFYQKQKAAASAHVGDPRELTTKVAGVTYDNRALVVERLVVGERLLLRRDPTNRYDKNAVAVMTLSGAQAGFIPKELAARLAPVMDAHGGTLAAEVEAVTGDPARGFNRGLTIRFRVPEVLPRKEPNQWTN